MTVAIGHGADGAEGLVANAAGQLCDRAVRGRHGDRDDPGRPVAGILNSGAGRVDGCGNFAGQIIFIEAIIADAVNCAAHSDHMAEAMSQLNLALKDSKVS